MFVMLASAKLSGLGDGDIWPMPDGLYWDATWQAWTNASHALPIYLSVLAIAYAARLDGLRIFAWAALLHIAFDLPVHREDGHAHFWPLSDWKFISPVSYWDPHHYGLIMLPVEAIIVIGTLVVLWRRYRSRRSRLVLGGAAASFAAAPLYFILTHH
ncbi:MAG: hypothetical protein R3D57_16560 [Hyphomicrobiaceae bacterium]